MGRRIPGVPTSMLSRNKAILRTSEWATDPHSGTGDKHHPQTRIDCETFLPAAPNRYKYALCGESSPVKRWRSNTLDYPNRPVLGHDAILSRKKRTNVANV